MPFLQEKKKKIEKVKKLICSIQDKEKYVIHIRALKKGTKLWIKTKKSTQSNSI